MIDVPVRVKDALRDGRMLKNYKFNVLNDDGTTDFTIDNDTLVSESVKINERMCTGNQLKFGLCEGSSLEFQYFDHPNITGRQIQAFIDVQYVDADNKLQWYEIPMGFFTVDQCPMQFSTGIRKVTAYNKLRSAYLDQKCNTALIESLDDPNTPVSVLSIRNYFLSNYEIIPVGEKVSWSGYVYTGYASGPTAITGDSDDTPFNKYQVQSNPIDIHTTYDYGRYTFTVDPDKYYQFMETTRTLSDCQAEFVRYMTKLIDDSPVNMTGAQVVSQMSADLWKRLFAIHVVDRNNNEYWYSDYPFKNGVSGFNGTINDFIKTIIHDAISVELRIPSCYEIYSYNSNVGGYFPEYQYGYFYGEVNEFFGRDERKTYPALHYPDGETIPRVTGSSYPFEDWFNLYELPNVSPADMVSIDPKTVPDFTLRDLVSSSYETVAQYGKLDRVTDLFSGMELNGSRLVPSDTLYPANDLYPNGNSVRANKSMYQKLWTDSQGVQTFRYLIITYKGLDSDNQEVEKTLQRTVNADGTTDYNMSDNWLFKNLVWSDADVGDYADAMVLKMQNVTWFPFEMWCAGLPYIETGDELEISNSEGTYTSYVLQRQLNGIQNLQDTFIDGELDIF